MTNLNADVACSEDLKSTLSEFREQKKGLHEAKLRIAAVLQVLNGPAANGSVNAAASPVAAGIGVCQRLSGVAHDFGREICELHDIAYALERAVGGDQPETVEGGSLSGGLSAGVIR